ncbi:PDZ domain-containing protein [Candidatus Uhrbacteria bacterium]|nr:PDZ domain-containing protein [Candidatus Uhrbacteria bacterium]
MFYTARPKSKLVRKFISSAIVAVFIAVSFIFGWSVGRKSGTPATTAMEAEGGLVQGKNSPAQYLLQDVNFDLFWEVWDMVKDRYVEQPVFDTQLFYGALTGVVGSLGDPYSVFLDPETTQKFTAELSGVFEGIGAEIGIQKEQLVIIAPLPGTPAEASAVRSGDRIIAIDGQDTRGMPLDIAVSNIRGPKGSTVELTLLREGWDEPRKFPIIRDTINIESVRFEKRKDGLAYLKIVYFNESTPGLFEQAIQQIISQNPKGIILDLRNNPGGFLEVAVSVASAWVPSGEVVVWQEFQGSRKEAFRAQGTARLGDIPTAVLINNGSASASEIVAGALRDHGKGKLIGETTFGKGSVQSFEQLRGGSALKLTIAHWLTPKGQQIEGEGIVPDIAVEMTRDNLDNGEDPQLKKAMELLK